MNLHSIGAYNKGAYIVTRGAYIEYLFDHYNGSDPLEGYGAQNKNEVLGYR